VDLLTKRDPELAAYTRHFKKEQECEDLDAFLRAYARATGEELGIEDCGESPDFICRRADGSLIGVELTQIRRSPEQARWEAILDYQDEMRPGETSDEIDRLVLKKAELKKKFRIQRNILMLALRESDFDLAVRLSMNIPLEDLETTGFEEIWLADFKGIWDGAHREAMLFGLYPEEYRYVTERSMFDQKPYG